MDESLTRAINGLAGGSSTFDALLLTITNYGAPALMLMTVLQWWVRADRAHVRHACIAAAMSLGLGLVVNFTIILIFHRVRPYELGITHLIVPRSVDWSFPSDHATAAFAIAGPFLSALGAVRRWTYTTLAVLVSLSRVYVGTHYFGDVAGGALTGLAASAAVGALYVRDSKFDRFVTAIF